MQTVNRQYNSRSELLAGPQPQSVRHRAGQGRAASHLHRGLQSSGLHWRSPEVRHHSHEGHHGQSPGREVWGGEQDHTQVSGGSSHSVIFTSLIY